MPVTYKTQSAHITPIYIENGLRKKLPTLLPRNITEIFVLTDTNVYPLYGSDLCDALAAEGYNVAVAAMQAGESYKNWDTAGEILHKLSEADISKSGAILALGGGIVGDMAGFCGAVYLRGVRVFQVPTTLLAQVDSSIGGKNGVNLESGKNRAGTIVQPDGVFIDPETLSTLPEREFACGMAEVIKYAAAFDKNLFALLEAGNPDMQGVIARCAQIKAEIVERDEQDSGERQLLNFGHTLGHALEKLGNYKDVNHGEAVSIGMCALSRLAHKAGLGPDPARLVSLCGQYNLPVSAGYTKEEMLALLSHDKKRRGENLTLVLLQDIGLAKRETRTVAEWREVL